MKNINYILALVLLLFQNCNANSEIDRSIADTNSIGQGPINFVEAAKRVTPAVVHINTFTTQQQQRDLGPFEEFFEDGEAQQGESENQERGEMRLQGAGSGVIMTEDGYIITSNHIIQEAERIEVSLEDKRVYTASVVGTDPSTDLAVIKIEEQNLPIVEFGNSEELEVGQWVVAIGNPFELTSTVTAGIVSAKGRNLNILQGQEQRGIESFIQTDAAANPGNSGGALVNKDGLLVGIIAAIASPTGSFAGYSFAVPENLTRKVFSDIVEYGEVRRGLLGVAIQDLNPQIAEEHEIDDLNGVYVQEVNPGSAAEEAGLQSGDVIIAVEGNEVNSTSEVQEIVALERPGAELNITYKRNGSTNDTSVTLKPENGESVGRN